MIIPSARHLFQTTEMANRAVAHDDLVFSISDLKREGSQRLEPAYRDYYNDGAMDMLTYETVQNLGNLLTGNLDYTTMRMHTTSSESVHEPYGTWQTWICHAQYSGRR